MRWSARWTALGAALALAAAVMPIPSASATHEATLEVQVGAYLSNPDGSGVPGESMRFFPDDITVHKGDTLKFAGDFHTATLLPSSVTDVDAYLAENAAELGDPLHFVQNNPDNTTYPWKIPGFFPQIDCGHPGDACSYTGAEVLDSGVLFNYADFSNPEAPPVVHGFSVVVDANPGDVFWVVCLVHPNMRMRVTVAAPNETTTTQAEIDAEEATLIAEDRSAATALHQSLLSRHESTRRPNGTRVWKAWAGYDTEDFALFAMYPRRLRLQEGDRVRWEFTQLNHETHTVTHPIRRGLRVASSEPFLCDPNGDDTSGGETPPQDAPSPCPEGSEPEPLVSTTFALPQGDGVVRAHRDFESSGVRGQLGDAPALGFDPYALRFPRASRNAYKYACMLHPWMRGRIRVR